MLEDLLGIIKLISAFLLRNGSKMEKITIKDRKIEKIPTCDWNKNEG